MGLPYIDGYKPLGNYQQLLAEAVAEYLADHLEMVRLIARDAEADVAAPHVEDILGVLEDKELPEQTSPDAAAGQMPRLPWLPAIDYLAAEARNQGLGCRGERFVMEYERARLASLGRERLAERVEQVSAAEGSAAGYDVRSFEADGSDRFVEVKTTKYGGATPFYVTPRELRFAEASPDRYYVYRLFRFRRGPRLFMVPGNAVCRRRAEPTEYLVRVV